MMTPLPRVTEAIDQTKRCCVVNVATGHYCVGQARLVAQLDLSKTAFLGWANALPPGSPSHDKVPYAFKAYALHEAARTHKLVMWCDACIVPVKPLDGIWEYAQEHGAWFSRNGFSNYQWTADSAYPDLFAEEHNRLAYAEDYAGFLDDMRTTNRGIEHVVATAFALDLSHPSGEDFLAEYYRLASETKAFCGPWTNLYAPMPPTKPWSGQRVRNCGPPDVLGHRHDQTAASVIAWRLGIPLSNPPDLFAYKGGETDATVLVADGAY